MYPEKTLKFWQQFHVKVIYVHIFFFWHYNRFGQKCISNSRSLLNPAESFGLKAICVLVCMWVRVHVCVIAFFDNEKIEDALLQRKEISYFRKETKLFSFWLVFIIIIIISLYFWARCLMYVMFMFTKTITNDLLLKFSGETLHINDYTFVNFNQFQIHRKL